MKLDDLNYYEKSLLYTKFEQFIARLKEDLQYHKKSANEYLDDAKNEDGIVDETSWYYKQHENETKDAEATENVIKFFETLL